jgi:hypothetical protein
VDGLIQPMQMPWRIDYEGNDSFLVPECLLSASAGVVIIANQCRGLRAQVQSNPTGRLVNEVK